MSKIQIVIDERIRTATAVLAASNWPDREQAIKPHAVHQHSKQTRQFVSTFTTHPAVVLVNEALSSNQSVDTILTSICQGNQQSLLDDFATQSNIDSFWAEHSDIWEDAISECQTIFENCPLPSMLVQMGGQTVPILIMPTLIYPMLNPAVIVTEGETAVLLPPPKAWGESPPWPFKEDPIWVVVEAGKAILTHGLQSIWGECTLEDQHTLVQAGVALALETMFDDYERQAYVVRIKKEENIQSLPQLTAQLRDWLDSDRSQPIASLLVN